MRNAFKPLTQRIADGAATADEARFIIREILESFDEGGVNHRRPEKYSDYYSQIAIAMGRNTSRALMSRKAGVELEAWKSLVDFHEGMASRKDLPVISGKFYCMKQSYIILARLAAHPDKMLDRFQRALAMQLPATVPYTWDENHALASALQHRAAHALIYRRQGATVDKDRNMAKRYATEMHYKDNLGMAGQFRGLQDQYEALADYHALLAANPQNEDVAAYAASADPLPAGRHRHSVIEKPEAEPTIFNARRQIQIPPPNRPKWPKYRKKDKTQPELPFK